jgi:hypothetical protein
MSGRGAVRGPDCCTLSSTASSSSPTATGRWKIEPVEAMHLGVVEAVTLRPVRRRHPPPQLADPRGPDDRAGISGAQTPRNSDES